MDGADLELFRDIVRRAAERSAGEFQASLDEIGWRDALDSDRRGAITVVFEQQGFACATSSALDDVLLCAMGLSAASAGVVLGHDGSPDVPGRVEGDRLSVRGFGSAALVARHSAVVVASTENKQVAGVVQLSSVSARPVGGIDPAYGLVEIDGETTVDKLEPVDWPVAVALGQLALAHELVGASRKMLALAREHALQRT